MARSDLVGWAEYGYCANHTRYFWGLRLHLLCTLHGLPVAFALTEAGLDLLRPAELSLRDAIALITELVQQLRSIKDNHGRMPS